MKSLAEVFKRVVKPTTSMTVEISFSDGELSLVGYGRHGSGQVYEHIMDGTPLPPFTRKDCFRLKQIWQRWHLNYMRAGTPKQEEVVRKWRSTIENPNYEKTCKMLESLGLLTDGGYKYGSKWLKEEVPLDVLEWLFNLPGDGNTFSDVYSPEINQNDFDAILAGV